MSDWRPLLCARPVERVCGTTEAAAGTVQCQECGRRFAVAPEPRLDATGAAYDVTILPAHDDGPLFARATGEP